MKLLKISKEDNKGFSIIEIVVVLGIISLLLVAGLFISADSFESYYFISEEKLVSSLLRTARSRAVNNLSGTSHGLFIGESEFVLFQGESFDYKSSTNEPFLRNKAVEISSDFEDEDRQSFVIFQNLTGRLISNEGTIYLTALRHSSTVEIESEGRINW